MLLFRLVEWLHCLGKMRVRFYGNSRHDLQRHIRELRLYQVRFLPPDCVFVDHSWPTGATDADFDEEGWRHRFPDAQIVFCYREFQRGAAEHAKERGLVDALVGVDSASAYTALSRALDLV